jgi:uncharacterized protein (DUF58 family)
LNTLLNRFKNFILTKIASKRIKHPVYILPTADGLKVIALNVILLVMGLIYANNYVLLLNFILFCLFLASMFYTHYNLNGLSITAIKSQAFFVAEENFFEIYMKTKNNYFHYYISCSISNKLFSSQPQLFNIEPYVNNPLKYFITPKKRGGDTLDYVLIQTNFPFNLFNCFTFIHLNTLFYVYPEKTLSPLNSNYYNDLNFFEFTDESEMKLYASGDSIKRIDWKRLAKTGEWFTRKNLPTTNEKIILKLDNERDLELSLSKLCFQIYNLEQDNREYGLQLDEKNLILPSTGHSHMNKCLKNLATYEA